MSEYDILFHPTRRRIVGLLKKSAPLSIKEIAARLDISEDLAGFHILALEQYGLTESDMVYAHSSPHRMEAQFKTTAKVRETVEAYHDLV